MALGGGREERLRVVRGERVEEGTQRRGDAVVQLVAGRPEGVAARLGELGEAEERVVAGDGLERDVRVPLVLIGLPAPVADPRGAAGAAGGAEAVRVERFLLLRGDDADFVVAAAVLTRRVADGVDVQARGGGLAGELAEALDEFLLEVVGEVVLLAEEDDAALGDWGVLVRVCRAEGGREGVLVMARSRRSSSLLGARSHLTRSTPENSRPMTGVTSNELNWSRAPLRLRGSTWFSRRAGRPSEAPLGTAARGLASSVGASLGASTTGAAMGLTSRVSGAGSGVVTSVTSVTVWMGRALAITS